QASGTNSLHIPGGKKLMCSNVSNIGHGPDARTHHNKDGSGIPMFHAATTVIVFAEIVDERVMIEWDIIHHGDFAPDNLFDHRDQLSLVVIVMPVDRDLERNAVHVERI